MVNLLTSGVHAGLNHIQSEENSIVLGINGNLPNRSLVTNLTFGTENQQFPKIAGISTLYKDYSQTLGFTLLLLLSAFLLSCILVNNIKKHERVVGDEKLNA